MKAIVKRCFNCLHIQPRRSGESFATICDKTGEPTNPSAVCKDFERQEPIKKKSPRAAKHKAINGKSKYSIKSRILRRVFRGVPAFSLTPRNEAEERMVDGFINRLSAIANDFARKVARKAVNRIGRED